MHAPTEMQIVSLKYELLNISVRYENVQSFSYTVSTQMIFLQCELLHVSASFENL